MKKTTKTDSPLEREFKQLLSTVGAEIERKLDIARKALTEAQGLADEAGIPFEMSLEFQLNRSGCYVPASFSQKFRDLDRQLIYDLTNIDDLDTAEYIPWNSSAC